MACSLSLSAPRASISAGNYSTLNRAQAPPELILRQLATNRSATTHPTGRHVPGVTSGSSSMSGLCPRLTAHDACTASPWRSSTPERPLLRERVRGGFSGLFGSSSQYRRCQRTGAFRIGAAGFSGAIRRICVRRIGRNPIVTAANRLRSTTCFQTPGPPDTRPITCGSLETILDVRHPVYQSLLEL